MRRPSVRVTVLDQTADFGILVPFSRRRRRRRRSAYPDVYFIPLVFLFHPNVPIVSKVKSGKGSRVRRSSAYQWAGSTRVPGSSAAAFVVLAFVVSGLFCRRRRPAESGPHHGDHEWMNETCVPGFRRDVVVVTFFLPAGSFHDIRRRRQRNPFETHRGLSSVCVTLRLHVSLLDMR